MPCKNDSGLIRKRGCHQVAGGVCGGLGWGGWLLPALGGGVACGVCGGLGWGVWWPWVGCVVALVGGGSSPASPADTPDTHPPKEKIFFASPARTRNEARMTPLTVETKGGSGFGPSPAGHGKSQNHKPRPGNRLTPEESQRTQTNPDGGKKNFFLWGVAAGGGARGFFFANPARTRNAARITPVTVTTKGGSACAPSPAGHGIRRKHKPRQGNRRTLKSRNEPRQTPMGAKKTQCAPPPAALGVGGVGRAGRAGATTHQGHHTPHPRPPHTPPKATTHPTRNPTTQGRQEPATPPKATTHPTRHLMTTPFSY